MWGLIESAAPAMAVDPTNLEGIPTFPKAARVATSSRLPSSATSPSTRTPEQLFAPHESMPWNPLIAHTLYRRGIIEEWGRGIAKITEQTAAAGLAPPEIEDAGGCVTVRFWNNRYVPPRGDAGDLTKRQEEILVVLGASAEPLASREIGARLGKRVSRSGLLADLAALRRRGLVGLTGRGRSARWKRV